MSLSLSLICNLTDVGANEVEAQDEKMETHEQTEKRFADTKISPSKKKSRTDEGNATDKPFGYVRELGTAPIEDCIVHGMDRSHCQTTSVDMWPYTGDCCNKSFSKSDYLSMDTELVEAGCFLDTNRIT